MRKVHEHIIQLPPFVTREQLWQGIEMSVRHPEKFVEHMEGCDILDEKIVEEALHISREIDFGNKFKLRDTVVMRLGTEAKTLVPAGETWPASAFLMKIEEPEKGNLFVRFIYESDELSGSLNPMVEELRRQAYEAKDHAMIDDILKGVQQGDLS